METRGRDTVRATVAASLCALVCASIAGAATYAVEWDGSGDYATIQDAIAAGCPDCDSPVTDATWGRVKALYR